MPHKILFTGSIDAGKSTLSNHFSYHPKIYVVKETARQLLIGNPDLSLQPEFQDILFHEQLLREEAVNSGKPIIICDRGVFDIITYSIILDHPIKPQWLESLRRRYQTVALFSVTDIPFDLSSYPLNLEIAKRRNLIDHVFREKALELDCPIIEIRGTHEERVKFFRAYIENLVLGEGYPPGVERR